MYTDSGQALELPSQRGSLSCAFHEKSIPSAAVVMVGGGDGGLDGPAQAIYPTLGEDLSSRGIATLRVDFRVHQFPGDVEEAVHDILVGARYLLHQGYQPVGVLGHSFGGAVVIEAAAREQRLASVVTLASQTVGAQRVVDLAPRPLLLIHGLDDTRLSPDCSKLIYGQASEPKQLVLLKGATHSLRQQREVVRRLVGNWFVDTLILGR